MGLRGSLACLALLLFSLVAAFPQPQEEDNDLEMEGEEDINEEEDEEEEEEEGIEDYSDDLDDIWETSSVEDFVTLDNEVEVFDAASIPCCQGPGIESCVQVSVDQSQLGREGVIELVENLKLKFINNMEHYSRAYLYMGRAGNTASFICHSLGCQGQVDGEKGEEFALEYCGPKYGHVWKKYSQSDIDYSEPDYDTDYTADNSVESVEDVDETTFYFFSIKFYYTTDFRRKTPDIDCAINQFIMEANLAYAKSHVPLFAYALCREEAKDIKDVQNVTEMLEQFKNYKNMSIKELRDSADVAILLTMNTEKGGKAFGLDGYKTGNSIAVVQKMAARKLITLAHEIGHIFGLAHDRNNTSKNRNFDFGYGHYIPGQGMDKDRYRDGFRTVMSYPKEGENWPRTPFFSNPDVDHDVLKKPTGTETANNARVLLITRQRVSELGDESSATCTGYSEKFDENFLMSCNYVEDNFDQDV